MEHRWGERFAVDIVVRLGSRPYAVRTGRLIDLSMSGGSIAIGMDLRVLSRVQVALVLPARFSQATPVISAYVARRHQDGVGVEWCDFAPQTVVELLRSSAPHRRDLFAVRGAPGGAPDRTAAQRSGRPRNMRHH